MKCHAGHIEVAVSKLIGYRSHTIVPNVSWGLGLRHECDMLVLDKSSRFTEIEIKITLSDLKADFKKNHGHRSNIISRLVYAMPRSLYERHGHIIPVDHGVIVVDFNEILGAHCATWIRMAKHDKLKQKPELKTVLKFMSLGCMRIWSLKEKLNHKLEKKVKQK